VRHPPHHGHILLSGGTAVVTHFVPRSIFPGVNRTDSFSGWTAEQVADAKRWVETWRRAGVALERVRANELKSLDTRQAISRLLVPGPPLVAPRPSSGLVEQQRWFMRMTHHS
jgi:hypothetical protein